MSLFRVLALLVLASLAVPGNALQPDQPQAAIDSDRDGLSDALEQALLDKFAPTFYVSATECDALPATFRSDNADPLALSRDGRIYGQASPLTRKSISTVAIELHYYHLWSRDCGRMGHPLDAEHVSVIVSAPSLDSPDSAWKAEYWYAAAHEDTVCEASRWATAASLDAVEHGAGVWISAGKHASYFSESLCHGGCGGDRCELPIAIPKLAVVNVGEGKAPMNGALWTSSPKWQLSSKMSSDFPELMLTALQTAPFVEMKHSNSKQAIISNSSTTYGGLAIGADHTGDGMGTGTRHTGRALGTAYRSVKNGLKWAFTGRKKPDAQKNTDRPADPPQPPTTNVPSEQRESNDI